MPKTKVNVEIDPTYNRINKLTITNPKKKKVALSYVYNADGFLRDLELEGDPQEMPSIAEVARMMNNRFLDRIGLINLINTINTIININTVGTIGTIQSIEKVRGLEWYDRTPIIGSMGGFSNSQAPSGDTAIASYAVPANRAVLVTSAMASVKRVTAATTPGVFRAWVEIDGLRIVDAFEIVNTIGAGVSMAVGFAGVALTGQVIACYRTDASIGGTYAWSCWVQMTEFDR